MKRSLKYLFAVLLSLSLLSLAGNSHRLPVPDNIGPSIRRWISSAFKLPQFVVLPYRYAGLLLAPAPDRLPIPVDGVKESRLYGSFGAPRSGNRKHAGIDIFAGRNTPVRSTTDGIVIRRGTNRLGGTVISVLGPGGQVHYYAHLERYGDFHRFDWVNRGDIIGYVGNSGNAKTTPTHLHYGIYSVTGAIDPYPLLAEQKEVQKTDIVSRGPNSQKQPFGVGHHS